MSLPSLRYYLFMVCRVAVGAALAVFVVSCGGNQDVGGEDEADAGTPAIPDSGMPIDLGPDEAYIFDSSKLHHFELEVAPEDWESLRQNALLEEYVPATFLFEGERYDGAAVRFKGDWNSLIACFEDGVQICDKLSIKISFNEYGKGRFAGLRKLVLNSSVRDPSLMHDVAGYWLYRSMGLPAPRASHAQLIVNGESQGLFVLIEQIDKELVQEHWESDEGNLYKSVWPKWDTDERYVKALRTNEESADVSDMVALNALVASTSEEKFARDMNGTLDLAELARFLAVDRAINNADGSGRFYCYDHPEWELCYNNNFYWYNEPGGGFHLLPWDLDHALYDVNTDLGRSLWNESCDPIPACEIWGRDPCPPDEQEIGISPTQCDSLYGHIHRATWDDYLRALHELVKGPMSVGELDVFLVSQRDKIRAAVEADEFGPGIASWLESNAWMDVVLANQRLQIQTLLDEYQN